jgi:hypothetical protein
MNDEELIPENEDSEDELRYAPKVEAEINDSEPATADHEEVASGDSVFEDEPAESMMPIAPELDLDAALAAVSTLDDMLAEQEAAEQAALAREQAEYEAQEQRQARLRNPEFFFPMPPMLGIQRGRMDSVIPALALIVTGIWLTLTLTTGGALQPALLLMALAGGLALTFLARWLVSGRWALGALFIGLAVLLTGLVAGFLLLNQMLVSGWPLLLAGPGLAFLLAGLLAGESRMLLPGLGLTISGLAGLLVTSKYLPEGSLNTLAALWPAALLILAILLILPLIARRQRQ